MKIRLIKRYHISNEGDVLNSVPTPRAMRMIKNGIAVLVEEKKPKQKAKTK